MISPLNWVLFQMSSNNDQWSQKTAWVVSWAFLIYCPFYFLPYSPIASRKTSTTPYLTIAPRSAQWCTPLHHVQLPDVHHCTAFCSLLYTIAPRSAPCCTHHCTTFSSLLYTIATRSAPWCTPLDHVQLPDVHHCTTFSSLMYTIAPRSALWCAPHYILPLLLLLLLLLLL